MSLYRCAKCCHGRHLYAWSQAVAYGPVHPDGLLAVHEDTEDCFLFVDSIECAIHLDASIQTKIDGRFRVWVQCVRCDGTGHYRYGSCPDCGRHGGSWELPAVAPARSLLGADEA